MTAASPALNLPASGRYDRLDALRGVAMVWMAVFHFCFDLNYFKLIPAQNFNADPFWTWQRTCIVSLFLFCAGMSQAVAQENRQLRGQDGRRFWLRWLQIAGCALLVTAGSALMFPRSYITFGVLHGIAVMLLITRFVGALRFSTYWLVPAGALIMLLPHFARNSFFDSRWTNWIGLVTRKPMTEDYVPLIPWLGVMWWGLAAGTWVLSNRRHWLTAPIAPVIASLTSPLATLGRWALSFYMVHQPVLIGILTAVVALKR